MGYLSKSSFEKLKDLEGKKIAKVVYYLWDNLKSEDDFKSLDWLSIKLNDGKTIILNYGENSDGLEVVDFDFEKERSDIESQFNNQITLIHENATLDVHWFPILDEKIRSVSFDVRKGDMMNDRVIFEFTDSHKIEIFKKEEGMGVDFYEE